MSGLEVDDLNAMTPGAALAALAPLFEGAPRFLARLVAARPFPDWAALFEVARSVAHAMPEAEQVELVDAHPRLGAPPGTVSVFSFREQGYDRAAASDARGEIDVAGEIGAPGEIGVAAELARLNTAYEARFGFRYCVVVAGRSREALLPGMAAALGAERQAELHRALDAVVDIAVARATALGASSG